MLLELKDIHVYYDKSYILKGVNLAINKGEIVALFGRNGAGKTSTLRTIMGLTSAKGRVDFEGINISMLTPYQRARKGIGYIPQDKMLFTKMTVYENLVSGMIHFNKKNIDMVLEFFPVLKNKMFRKANSLSGGEQQMLAIARALVSKPEILLLDEPSTGLMPLMITRVGEVIKELNRLGISILIVEEKIHFALNLAHKVYIMNVGKIVHSCDAQEIGGDDLIARYLGVVKC
jgi:branched-chain amino acid transport system ATP-binding protein